MLKILLLMGGGAIGTVLRYFTYEITKSTGPLNLLGTVSVNLAGSFAIGLLWGYTYKETQDVFVKNFLFIGLLGGYTTFSTYSLNIMNLLQQGNYKMLALYAGATNILAVLLVIAGFLLGKSLSLE